MSVFQVLTPITYWLLIAMWAYILFFLMRRLRFRRVESSLIITLIIVLAIDAFRTLFESIYFGAWYTSLSGFLPIGVHNFLVRAEMVIIPKFLNVITAALIIGILLYRWFPAEKRDRELLEGTIKERTIKLEKNNEQLRQEITERKRVEKALEESEEKYRAIFNEARDGIVLLDSETGRIAECNKEFEMQTGRSTKQLQKMKIWELRPPDKIDAAREKFAEIKRKGSGSSADLEFQKPDGEIVDIEFISKAIRIGGKQYLQSISRDITERKRMQEQLIITDRLASIGELTSGIAHELNNPLTGIIGFSDLLLDKDVPDDVKEDLKVINREAKRTAGVVKNLLTFARKHPEEKQSVDVSKVIQGVLELRAYEQKVNNIQVNTHFTPNLPEITANGFELQQVFINIIINAEHFMTEAHGKGILTVTTEQVGDIIRASFADDGPGITQENLGHVFDPFFTTKEVGKGTGLGLSICHGIITSHGGRIYAESELGKGTTFVVELPIGKQK